jgi:protein-tyrosine phosphatase
MENQAIDKTRILFVCLGNICRSPAAQGVMQQIVDNRGVSNKFYLDSAGLYGGHAGELPDKRMRIHASRRGYELTHHSRPVKSTDFEDFDLIIAMDDSNYHRLRSLAPTPDDERKVVRIIDFTRFHPYNDCVPDPYYDGAEGFELVLDLLEDACQGIADKYIDK